MISDSINIGGNPRRIRDTRNQRSLRKRRVDARNTYLQVATMKPKKPIRRRILWRRMKWNPMTRRMTMTTIKN
jgi:hypothetical protein